MDLNPFFKSIIEQDRCIVIVCDLEHKIIYMNPTAIKTYAKKNVELLGKSLLDCHNADSVQKIKDVVNWFAADKAHNIVHTFFNVKQQKDVYMVALRDDSGNLIGYYEKHEFRTPDPSGFYEME